ncbi:MAG: anti-sigma factor antagonist [Verrucomicrobiota bacterium]|jgi:anti-sigma B factor antagonist
MKLQDNGDTLRIYDVQELSATNANSVRDLARAALAESQRNIEIDLSQTASIDSCGLGTLVALHKTVCSRRGTLRLLNPTAPVQQILELTRMHRLFEIVKQ